MIQLLILLHVYFVTFTDKAQTGEPALSPRAVEQRTKWNIATDALDYPVNETYLQNLRQRGVSIYHTSRWFNGATCEMEPETADQVKVLNFVQSVEMTREGGSTRAGAPKRRLETESTVELRTDTAVQWTNKQLEVYNLPPLHNAGYKGQGILMTVCDGAFANANQMSCFRPSLELGHFDFTDDTDDFYGYTGDHGTKCLSAISGIMEGYTGAATEASYYLMRSEERLTESPKEMDNLVAALEKADSLGVNIFSVSLGYAQFNNPAWNINKETDLDGQKTRVSRAATIAARKGMLVCVAAGNEGAGEWRQISVPCDADSVLTVGAVDTLRQIGDFSSYGPTSDGRIKPEVCAVGVRTTLINPSGTIVNSNGTSFATPLLAGMAACLWSALPNENAMQIRERIIRSAEHYGSPDPDHHYGYGIPDAWTAFTMNLPTGLEHVTKAQETKDQVTKILREGQIYIIRGDMMYDLYGRKVAQ